MAEQGLSPQLRAQLQMTLLSWYQKHARVLPWRAVSPARMNPYSVWLSEIMLQQTTVAAVKDYFVAFTRRWPTVEALAAAPLDDVLRAWAGLGYYARARNLHKCAQVVAHGLGGRFPETPDGLQALPGIGPYTAGAIAAIAFDKPMAAVDGNVERVLSRLLPIEVPLPDSKPLIRDAAQRLMPAQQAGDFVQALMDLGATICTPRSPQCGACPWVGVCKGRSLGIAEMLPRKRAKKPVPSRHGHAYLAITEEGDVLLRRRPEKGLLGGMMEVPGSEWAPEPPDEAPPFIAQWQKRVGVVEHTFTHFHLQLTVWRAEHLIRAAVPLRDEDRWVSATTVQDEALPTVMRKVLAHGLPQWHPARKPSK